MSVTLEQAFVLLEEMAETARRKAVELSTEARDEHTAELILLAAGNFNTVSLLLRTIRSNMGVGDDVDQLADGGPSQH